MSNANVLQVSFVKAMTEHQYRGSYRIWCSCGDVSPIDRPERIRGVNVAALHREHLSAVLVGIALVQPIRDDNQAGDSA